MVNDIIVVVVVVVVVVVAGFDNNGRLGDCLLTNHEQIAQIKASQKIVTQCHFPGFISRTLNFVRPLYCQAQKARNNNDLAWILVEQRWCFGCTRRKGEKNHSVHLFLNRGGIFLARSCDASLSLAAGFSMDVPFSN